MYEPVQKQSFLKQEGTPRFTTITDLNKSGIDNIYQGKYVFLIPEVRSNQTFNIFYQLGVMRAYESLKIENKIEFVEEMKINIDLFEKAFFVGPFKSSMVQDYSLDQDKDNFLFMNYSEVGKFIPTNKMMQINLIEYFFNLSEGYKFDVIASKNEISMYGYLIKDINNKIQFIS